MKLPDRIYHVAEASNWPAIRRHGLLSASRLLAAARMSGADRERLERAQRIAHTTLPSGAEIRDQLPIPAAALEKCLCGMTAAEWYATVNARVFFWLDPARMDRQRAACHARPQVVLTVDTQALVDAHAERIAVTPINTGNARRKPARRGAATFVALTDWQRSGWASEAAALETPARKRSHVPVELTVLDSVPDIMAFILAADLLAAGESLSGKRETRLVGARATS